MRIFEENAAKMKPTLELYSFICQPSVHSVITGSSALYLLGLLEDKPSDLDVLMVDHSRFKDLQGTFGKEEKTINGYSGQTIEIESQSNDGSLGLDITSEWPIYNFTLSDIFRESTDFHGLRIMHPGQQLESMRQFGREKDMIRLPGAEKAYFGIH